MQKYLITLCVLSLMAASVPAYAQDTNNLDSPNGSSTPVSNAPTAAPNEPDHTFGRSSSTYKLPTDVPTQSTTSKPTYHQPADDDQDKN